MAAEEGVARLRELTGVCAWCSLDCDASAEVGAPPAPRPGAAGACPGPAAQAPRGRAAALAPPLTPPFRPVPQICVTMDCNVCASTLYHQHCVEKYLKQHGFNA
jgi:hypothetical protein